MANWGLITFNILCDFEIQYKMGNSQGNLTVQELNALADNSGLSEQDLKHLYTNFQKFDKDDKGYVNKADILNKLQSKTNKDISLLNKVIEQFENYSKFKEIDFNQLVATIHAFDENKKEEKLRFLFELIDTNKDGLIGAKELEEGFRLVKLEPLKNQDLTEIAQQTLLYADHDNDGFMNFEEFKEFYNSVLQISI